MVKHPAGKDHDGKDHHYHSDSREAQYKTAQVMLENAQNRECGDEDPRVTATIAEINHWLNDKSHSTPTVTKQVEKTASGAVGTGIFGKIEQSEVIGYHLDDEVNRVYMPVTRYYQALKAAQDDVASWSPGLADLTRKVFDYIENCSIKDKSGILSDFGTWFFPKFGNIAESYLNFRGKGDDIKGAYTKTTNSPEEYKALEKEGLAKLIPSVVITAQNRYLPSNK